MNEPDVVAEVDRQGARQVIEDVMKAAHERQRMQEQRHMHQQQVVMIFHLTPRLSAFKILNDDPFQVKIGFFLRPLSTSFIIRIFLKNKNDIFLFFFKFVVTIFVEMIF